MNFSVKNKENDLFIIGDIDFTPKSIFENGQAFRWEENQGKVTFVADKYIVKLEILDLEQKKELFKQDLLEDVDVQVVKMHNAGNIDDYNNFWKNYFDLSRDYKKLREELSKIDDNLKIATEFGKGFRVLKQDLFEMIISFIISANNNIKRIKVSVDRLCKICGDELGVFEGNLYYRFPTPEAIAKLSIEEIESTGVGYRAAYIKKTAEDISNGNFDLKCISDLSYEDAHKELVKLMGVGPKVADCILLFGNSRDIAFPVDTWVMKLMNYYYGVEDKNIVKIKKQGIEIFGEKAGLAQQYLFYYARENNIGKK